MLKDINMDTFYSEALSVIDTLQTKEKESIQNAAKICADTMMNDGVVHVFGSGHSVGFGMELRNRVGSLVPFHLMETSHFVLKGKVSLEVFRDPVNHFERKAGLAGQFYDLYNISKHDSFIIISNSGINGMVIDMALYVKEKGHKVIVVTSWQHTSSEASRHPSGKKLYELADVVIDNCGPMGDALIETTGPKICSISSITGAYIAQSLTIETCKIMIENNYKPPVFVPNDTEENIKRNQELLEKYEGRWN